VSILIEKEKFLDKFKKNDVESDLFLFKLSIIAIFNPYTDYNVSQ